MTGRYLITVDFENTRIISAYCKNKQERAPEKGENLQREFSRQRNAAHSPVCENTDESDMNRQPSYCHNDELVILPSFLTFYALVSLNSLPS